MVISFDSRRRDDDREGCRQPALRGGVGVVGDDDDDLEVRTSAR